MLSSYRTESLEANREQEAGVLHTADSPGELEAGVLHTVDSPRGLEANRVQEDSPGGLEARMETADSPWRFEDGSPRTAVTTGMITTKDHKYMIDLQMLSSVCSGSTSSQWEPEPSKSIALTFLSFAQIQDAIGKPEPKSSLMCPFMVSTF
jgi:hypothetical protein